MKGRNSGNFTNPCLTMHQPWASLLVYGIKRIEGRSWPAPLRGRIWIHAASKVPEDSTIKAMEEFYREAYALDGITDLEFPEHYPVSRLLGCVEVVGCVRGDELKHWDKVPEGVRMEAQTDFCWLCEQPQKLLIPFEMRGNQGVYNLEKKIFEAAVRGLTRVKGPLAVKFQLPDPRDEYSLKPGSISSCSPGTSKSELEKSSKLNAVIAGARAAATQFSRKNQDTQTSVHHYTSNPGRAGKSRTEFLGGNKRATNFGRGFEEVSPENIEEQTSTEFLGGNKRAINFGRGFEEVSPENIEEQTSSYRTQSQDPQTSGHHYTSNPGRAGKSRTEFLGGNKRATNFGQGFEEVSPENIEEQTSSYRTQSQDPQTSVHHYTSNPGRAGKSRTEFLGGNKRATNFGQGFEEVSSENIEEQTSSSYRTLSQDPQTSVHHYTSNPGRAGKPRTEFLGGNKRATNFGRGFEEVSPENIEEQTSGYCTLSQPLCTHPRQHNGAPSKIFAAALRGLRQA